MAYCGPRGIPLSVFLGRVVGPGDPVWLLSDRDAALAWAEREARICKRCGTDPEAWDEDPLAFHAHLQQCKGCQEQQRASESPDARNGRGIAAVVVPGPAGVCPRCQPLEDD